MTRTLPFLIALAAVAWWAGRTPRVYADGRDQFQWAARLADPVTRLEAADRLAELLRDENARPWVLVALWHVGEHGRPLIPVLTELYASDPQRRLQVRTAIRFIDPDASERLPQH